MTNSILYLDCSVSDRSTMSEWCYQRNHSTPLTIQWLVTTYEFGGDTCIPRSTVYNNYLSWCNENLMKPVNPASFGKIIRKQFSHLTTRRLGTRGQSKYHYYGLQEKAASHTCNRNCLDTEDNFVERRVVESNMCQGSNYSFNSTTPSLDSTIFQEGVIYSINTNYYACNNLVQQ